MKMRYLLLKWGPTFSSADYYATHSYAYFSTSQANLE